MTATEFVSARERLGLTREDVAAQFNLPSAAVSAWERGAIEEPAIENRLQQSYSVIPSLHQ